MVRIWPILGSKAAQFLTTKYVNFEQFFDIFEIKNS